MWEATVIKAERFDAAKFARCLPTQTETEFKLFASLPPGEPCLIGAVTVVDCDAAANVPVGNGAELGLSSLEAESVVRLIVDAVTNLGTR